MERWTDGPRLRIAIRVLACLSLVPSVHLSAQEPPLNAGALFLVFPVGAQAVGMGQTATASAGRGEAAFWNPAGLATLSDDEFALHSASLVAGTSSVLAAYFPSRGIGVIGGAVYLVDYGDLDRTDQNGNTIARIAPRNFEFLASYATNLTGSFVFGVTAGIFRRAGARLTPSTSGASSVSAPGPVGRYASGSRCATSAFDCRCRIRRKPIHCPPVSPSARCTKSGSALSVPPPVTPSIKPSM